MGGQAEGGHGRAGLHLQFPLEHQARRHHSHSAYHRLDVRRFGATPWSTIKGLTAYYQYSGDPVAFVYIPRTVDYILDYGLTDEKADWPLFPISTPTRGKAYGKCDPAARNQLDLCAIVGTEVLRAHKLTGNPRYLQMAEHWGDVFAAKCQFTHPDFRPWNRYVDPSVVGWSDVLTGTTSIIVDFLDDLIHIGYTGKGRRNSQGQGCRQAFSERADVARLVGG